MFQLLFLAILATFVVHVVTADDLASTHLGGRRLFTSVARGREASDLGSADFSYRAVTYRIVFCEAWNLGFW